MGERGIKKSKGKRTNDRTKEKFMDMRGATKGTTKDGIKKKKRKRMRDGI